MLSSPLPLIVLMIVITLYFIEHFKFVIWNRTYSFNLNIKIMFVHILTYHLKIKYFMFIPDVIHPSFSNL